MINIIFTKNNRNQILLSSLSSLLSYSHQHDATMSLYVYIIAIVLTKINTFIIIILTYLAVTMIIITNTSFITPIQGHHINISRSNSSTAHYSSIMYSSYSAASFSTCCRFFECLPPLLFFFNSSTCFSSTHAAYTPDFHISRSINLCRIVSSCCYTVGSDRMRCIMG